MSFYVYIPKCSDDSYYTGHTDDLEKRMWEHTNGEGSIYPALRRPVQLAFVEQFASREEAFVRERQIKGWTRGKKQALIQRDWPRLVQLSNAHGSTGSP